MAYEQTEFDRAVHAWKKAQYDAGHWQAKIREAQANLDGANRREEKLRARVDDLVREGAASGLEEAMRRADLSIAEAAFRWRREDYAETPCQETLDAMHAARRAVEAARDAISGEKPQ